MKRSIEGLIFLILLVVAPFAFTEPIDLVVLMDTSESMMPYFDNTVQYLLKDIMKEHMRYGDSFHLISFADEPEFELAKTIKDEKDIEEIVARILLLAPLGKYTDLISALKYLYDYTEDLSRASKKTILILTDGIHDPPPGSPYAVAATQAAEVTRQIAQDIKREGWDVNLLEYPEDGKIQAEAGAAGESAQNEKNLLPSLADDLKVPIVPYTAGNGEEAENLAHSALGAPEILFPQHLGRVRSSFTVPFKVKNYRETPVLVRLNQVMMEGQNVLNKPASVKVAKNSTETLEAQIVLPKGMELGEKSLPVELIFDDSVRVFPTNGVLSFTYVKPGLSVDLSAALRITLLVLFIIICVGLLFLLFRRLFTTGHTQTHIKASERAYPGITEAGKREQKSPVKEMQQNEKPSYEALHESLKSEAKRQAFQLKPEKKPEEVSLPVSRGEREIPKRVRTVSKPIELKVSYKRLHRRVSNIHWFSEGTKRSVGGSGCEYFLDLPSVTGKIGEISLENGTFVFTPTRIEFFPDLVGPVYDCLKKKIRILPSIDEETVFTFVEYIPPVELVNRIMHLIDKPGKPGFDY